MQNHKSITALGWMDELAAVIRSSEGHVGNRPATLEGAFLRVEQVFREVRSSGNSVWWVGNGGSAGICQHLSQDLLNKIKIRSFTIGEVPLVTCMANDFGYAQVYSRPLETLVREGDLIVAISSSGKSENILNCARLSVSRKLRLITLSGFDRENPLWKSPAEVGFYTPSSLYGIVETAHGALLHGVIEAMCLGESG